MDDAWVTPYFMTNRGTFLWSQLTADEQRGFREMWAEEEGLEQPGG